MKPSDSHKFWLLASAMLLSTLSLAAPCNDSDSTAVVQVSGLVVTGDSLSPLPYCTIFRARDRRGTMTDLRGFFSLPALEGDTLSFSSVGYIEQQVVIPEGGDLHRVNLVQAMSRDTVNMSDAFVYPWPTKERFKQEFLALGLPNKGLDPGWEAPVDPVEVYDRLMEVGLDGQATSSAALAQQAQVAAYAGQAPPVNLLNPVAWAKFIQAIKSGDLKRQ